MKKSRVVRVLLWLVPVWLLLSAVGGIWMYFDAQKKQARKESLKFARSISTASMEGNLKILREFVGVRKRGAQDGIGLTRAASWIEGELGPSNTGYQWQKIAGPAQWPLLHTTLQGTEEHAPPVWIVAAYDSSNIPSDDPFGGRIDPAFTAGFDADMHADETLAALVAAAQSLAGEQQAATLHFVFVPHGHPPSIEVEATLQRLIALIRGDAPPAAVLCLWNFGGSPSLNLSTRSTAPALLGSGVPLIPAEAHEFTNTLAKAGFPAARVSTIATGGPRDANDLPAATSRLVELIQRLAAKK